MQNWFGEKKRKKKRKRGTGGNHFDVKVCEEKKIERKKKPRGSQIQSSESRDEKAK